jgi:hypothetical protein
MFYRQNRKRLFHIKGGLIKMEKVTARDIFFTSPEHKQRFLDAMERRGKIYGAASKFDPEYAACFYILSSHSGMWKRAEIYKTRNGIGIDDMLENEPLSSGETTLIALAGNLFNLGATQVNAVDITFLDDQNFNVALSAFKLRRYDAYYGDFVDEKNKTSSSSSMEEAGPEEASPDY